MIGNCAVLDRKIGLGRRGVEEDGRREEEVGKR